MFELIQYTPQTAKVRTVPLLIVPPTINKYYVIDLAEQRSLVEHLVANGQQVYCISWRNPDARHADWGLDTYGQAIIDAMDAAEKISPAATRSRCFGICSGGMLELDGARPPRRHRRPRPGRGVQPRGDRARPGAGRAAERAAVPQGGGRLDEGVAGEGLPRRPDAGRGVRLAAAQRPDLELLGQQLPARPRAQGVRHPLLERRPGADDGGHAPRLHGPRDQQRAHPSPGGARMLGTDLDLGKVDTDTYVVAGIADHLCKWESCYRTTQLLGGDTKFVLSTSGHIAAMVNPPGNPKASFQTAAENPADAAGVAGLGERRSRAPGGTTTSRGWPSAPARSATSRAGSARRPTSRSATPPAPMSSTAEPPQPAARDRSRSGGPRRRGLGRGPAAARSPTSRRCCCATASGPASRRSSRSSTRSTPTAGWSASTYPASAASPLPPFPYPIAGAVVLGDRADGQLGSPRVRRARALLGRRAGAAARGAVAAAGCAASCWSPPAPASLMVPAHPRVLRKMLTPRRHRDPAYAAEIAAEIYGGIDAQRPRRGAPTCCTRPPGPGPKRGYYYQLAAMTGWSSLPFLRLLRQPTLVMGGDDDPIIPVVNPRMHGPPDPPRAAARLPRRAPRHPDRGRRARPRDRRLPRRSGRAPHDRAATTSTSQDTPFSDFLGFELLLEDQDRELLSKVRAFMTREVEPVINDYWTRAAFPHDLVPGIAELGIAGLAYDGPGCPAAAPCVDGMVAMELARVDPSIAHLHGRARRAGDGLDPPVRLRRAARALAARDGADGADRRVRADRARRRLRRSPAASPRPPGATATSGSSTARRSGSATPPSPTSS